MLSSLARAATVTWLAVLVATAADTSAAVTAGDRPSTAAPGHLTPDRRLNTGSDVPAGPGYAEPVTPFVVVRTFAPPATRYGPGHLGVDLRSTVGEPVRAAADGTVVFAGQVAGRGVVVLVHVDGIRTEYEPVRPIVARAAVVRRGQLIALVDGTHPGCSGSCLHWGARRGDTYLDPLSLLPPLGPVTLLPWS